MGIGLSAAALALIIPMYVHFCSWNALENENDLNKISKEQKIKEKDVNEIRNVEDETVAKEKQFKYFIAFPNGTRIDKRILEKELHLKYLGNMNKLNHAYQIGKHLDELESNQETIVSAAEGTTILVSVMIQGYRIKIKTV